MTWSVAEARGSELEEVLAPLLAAEPHLEYANFAPVAAKPGAAAALHRDRWLDPDGRVAVLVARHRGRPRGALRLVERDFESRHFGISMAKVELPLADPDPDLRATALSRLYPAALDRLRQGGFAHAALRVSTRDREGAWCAQGGGARWVDTQVSWMCPLSGLPHDESLPRGLRIEIRDRDALGSLPGDAWKRLADWGGQAFDRGPMVFDLTLDPTRARQIYSEWTARVMQGRWSDVGLLAWDGDEVVAFISMLEMPDLSVHAGAKVCGRGLGATLPEYRGVFTAIQREMIAARPLGSDWMENETQAATIGSINVYAKLGFRYLRSTCTFHQRLAGVGPAASREPV